ncbi:MAG: CooT family nickel-binding protein [Clostridia bacterium]|nr:CooT family nickel-binding protein [Clostridia bacterium]
MCEANVYLKKGQEEILLVENVDRVVPQEDGILLEDIFGRRKLVRAKIKEMTLVDHKIFLEEV